MKNVHIFFLIYLFLTYGCKDNDCNFAGTYQFEIPATLTPAKATYRIGDTISISSRFSDQVYEAQTNKTYLLEDFRFYPAFIINEISDSIVDRSALRNFDFIIDTNIYNFNKFILTTGTIAYDGEFYYNNNEYSLEYKFIPKETGLYLLHQDAETGYWNDNQSFQGKCDNKRSNVRTLLNEEADNNIELARNSKDPDYNSWIFGDLSKNFTYLGGYVFYVEE